MMPEYKTQALLCQHGSSSRLLHYLYFYLFYNKEFFLFVSEAARHMVIL